MENDIEWGMNWEILESALDSHIDVCEEGTSRSVCFVETVLVSLLELNQRLESLESNEHRDQDKTG